MKQLAELGLVAEARWAKLLRKIPPEEMQHVKEYMLLALMEVSDEQLIRYLQHRRVVTAFEILLVASTAIMKRVERIDGDAEGRSAVAGLLLLHLNCLPYPETMRVSPRLRAVYEKLQQMGEDW